LCDKEPVIRVFDRATSFESYFHCTVISESLSAGKNMHTCNFLILLIRNFIKDYTVTVVWSFWKNTFDLQLTKVPANVLNRSIFTKFCTESVSEILWAGN